MGTPLPLLPLRSLGSLAAVLSLSLPGAVTALAGCTMRAPEPPPRDECGGERTFVRVTPVDALALQILDGTERAARVLEAIPEGSGTRLVLEVESVGRATVSVPIGAPPRRAMDLRAVRSVVGLLDWITLTDGRGEPVLVVGATERIGEIALERGERVCSGGSFEIDGCWTRPSLTFDGFVLDSQGARHVVPGETITAWDGQQEYLLLFDGATDWDYRAPQPQPACAARPPREIWVAAARLEPTNVLVSSCDEVHEHSTGATCAGFDTCHAADASCEPRGAPECVDGTLQTTYRSSPCPGEREGHVWRELHAGNADAPLGTGDASMRARLRWAVDASEDPALVDCDAREIGAEAIDWHAYDADGVVVLEDLLDTEAGACADWITIYDVSPGAHMLEVDAGPYHAECMLEAGDGDAEVCVMRLEG